MTTPTHGTYFPTRKELGDLIKEIVVDAAGRDSSVSQPLAEQLAQYFDAIYTPLVGKDSSFEELLDAFAHSHRRWFLTDEINNEQLRAEREVRMLDDKADLSRYVEQLKAENAHLRERVLSDSEMRELRNATMLHSSGISEELRRKLRRSTSGDTAQ